MACLDKASATIVACFSPGSSLSGKMQTLADGSTVLADETYLRRAIREPQAQVVKGFPPVMPPAILSDEEVAALVAYLQSLGSPTPVAPEQKAQR